MAFNNSSSSTQSQQLKQGTIEEDMNAQQQKKNNLIILVDKDSNDQLDELFQNTLNNKTALYKPFKQRNLPASFFQPPSSGSKSPSVSHSRENSADSAFGSGTTILGSNNATQNAIPSNHTIAPAIASGLPIHHSRAHSSPASLGKLPLNINLNLSALTIGSATPTNSPSSSGSSGNANNSANTSNKIALQQTATTNTNSNALNNNTSALISNQGCNNNLPQNILDKNMQHIHARARSYDIPSLQQQLHFGDLPPGWEQAKTHDGKIYYIK
jgi:protein yorkie